MPTVLSPVTIPDTELRVISSTVVGQEFSVFVALPQTYLTDSKPYPVIYAPDANRMFGIMTETVRGLTSEGLPEVIVVGIGYPVRIATATLGLRIRDLTPTETDAATYDSEFKPSFPGAPEYAGSGGAALFLRFLREELMPFIDIHYRTMPGASTLMGHSLGGLFALYVLLNQPDTFRCYIAGSPSVWWDNDVILSLEKDFAAQHSDLSAKVLLSVAGNEWEGMIAGMYKMADVLRSRNYKSMELTTHFFEGETHLSTIPAFISWGLRGAFAHNA